MAKLQEPPEHESFGDTPAAFKILARHAEYQSQMTYEAAKTLRGMNLAVQLVGLLALLTIVGLCLLIIFGGSIIPF